MTEPDPGGNGPGVYIHIPFCARRCDYCAFATWTDRGHLVDRYLAALARDIDRAFAAPGAPGRVRSVFVGGGTPTIAPASGLAAVLGRLPLAPDAEVTVETNPDSITAEDLDTLQGVGCNRLSIGVQSMVPHVLGALGRSHDVANVAAVAEIARGAGLASWNVDLIYGAAGESTDDWRETVVRALELEPPHISAYALTVEAGTALAADAARHPDDDDQAAKYEVADEAFERSGRAWYEISNWARPGHACRHNELYWSGGDYLAFGCAAHGHRQGRRWWNVRTPERYIEAVEQGESPVAAHEDLDDATRRREALQLAVRRRAGVSVDDVRPEVVDELDGLLERHGSRLVLTRRGRLLANEVAIRLE